MAGVRLLHASRPLPLFRPFFSQRRLTAASGWICTETICFAGNTSICSRYFHRQRTQHSTTITVRSTTGKAEPTDEDLADVSSTDKAVSGDEIRQRFLKFYASRGHKIIPSSSLVPDDPTVLLTIAGMLQFKPVFLGKEPRSAQRATTAQRCIRTNDIENVGRTARHHTFFEMLGNFSFGDYFKEEAIVWAWELTTKEFGLPSQRLWVSVFEDDDEAFNIWHTVVGVPKERIKRMGEDDNFWTSGVTGPCGPCSEIYYDFHPDKGLLDADLGDDNRFIELYNLVFMQYNKKDDGSLEPLKQKNIDTGMGLERMAQVLQKVPNNYETDLIFPIIEKASNLAFITYANADDVAKTKLKVHHTATHLLQAALKNVTGQETSQAGSLVAFDRLRFDFNFQRPLSEYEVAEIERLINKWIGDATHLQTKIMPLSEAKNAGAIAMFGEKYGEEVRVVEVPGVSMELCGGTHVNNTSEIRGFKIISEQGIASGIRRMEAVAGEAFIEYVSQRDSYMRSLCSMLKVRAEDVASRVENILEELRMTKNEVLTLRNKMAILKASTIKEKAMKIGTSNIRVLVESMGDTDAEALKSAAEYLIYSLQDPAAVVLGSCPGEGKVSLVAAFSPGVIGMGLQAGKFIGNIAKICGGGGGGRPNFAQAGGRKPENLLDALEKASSELVATLADKSA